MANRSSFILSAAGAWLALGLVAACNGVLGIEEAQQEPTTSALAGGSATGTAGGSSASAPTNLIHAGGTVCVGSSTDCTNCVAACDSQADCLGSHECRLAADDYSHCLGKTCTAPGEGSCGEQLSTAKSDDCHVKCAAGPCATLPLYSDCQLYCSCLGTACAGNSMPAIGANGEPATYPSMDACLMACASMDPVIVGCLRSHCEYASILGKPTPHCDHSVGFGNFCPSGKPPSRPANCQNLSLNGFACQSDGDCCSKNCGSNAACTD